MDDDTTTAATNELYSDLETLNIDSKNKHQQCEVNGLHVQSTNITKTNQSSNLREEFFQNLLNALEMLNAIDVNKIHPSLVPDGLLDLLSVLPLRIQETKKLKQFVSTSITLESSLLVGNTKN